jgi:hypothetical protein
MLYKIREGCEVDRNEDGVLEIKTGPMLPIIKIDSEDFTMVFEPIDDREDEINRLKGWINDLQSGMYINCVYCGHRYGPSDEVPESMADVLKKHIEECPEHPMSKLSALNRDMAEALNDIKRIIENAEMFRMRDEDHEQVSEWFSVNAEVLERTRVYAHGCIDDADI